MRDNKKESDLRLLLDWIHKKDNAYYLSWVDCIDLIISIISL